MGWGRQAEAWKPFRCSGYEGRKGGECGLVVYIAERRRAAGMTQEDLSARLGVDRSAVALWETGARTPGTERLPALAEALGCGIGELFAPPAAREEAG